MQLNCCGWDGPKEFAYNNEPIDESCYEKHNDGGGGGSGGDSANAIWASRRSDDGGENALPTKKMKQVRNSNQAFWVSSKRNCRKDRHAFRHEADID